MCKVSQASRKYHETSRRKRGLENVFSSVEKSNSVPYLLCVCITPFYTTIICSLFPYHKGVQQLMDIQEDNMLSWFHYQG